MSFSNYVNGRKENNIEQIKLDTEFIRVFNRCSYKNFIKFYKREFL